MQLDDIKNDLQEILPITVKLLSPPYVKNNTLKEKFNLTYKSLRRSIRLKSRTLSLVNAFYLGKLLANMDTTKEQFQYKQELTTHYATIAEYTYDIFEFYPEQLMRIQQLSVQIVRKLKHPQVLELRDEMCIFAGA